MLDVLSGFVAELRTAGIPISLGEHVDAANATATIDLSDREGLRSALSSTLVKRADYQTTFDRIFALYFATRLAPAPDGGNDADAVRAMSELRPEQRDSSPSELLEQITEALAEANAQTLRAMAALAVDRYAGIEPGRPVGSAYYLYRTMRHLRLDEVRERLAEQRRSDLSSTLDQHLAHEWASERVDQFSDVLHEEILTHLVNDRGAEAMAQASRRDLLEDVDVMRANRDELVQLEKALVPLSRKLAARLARKRRRKRRGPVDMRRTMRDSLSTGGVPLTIHFRTPHPAKPELVVLADMSGSVASFARFTLLLVHALHGEFSKVRSFVFVDAVDEVTSFFEATDDPAKAADRIADEAAMVAADGHSDYGRVMQAFRTRFGDVGNPRATLLVLGDARSNYHPAQREMFAAITRRFKRTYWLNPEPRAYWHSGDSVVGEYANYCDDVVECRTLRQLEAFVMGLS